MGEDQEKNLGSGAVMNVAISVESYERQNWDCSFENDGKFRSWLS